MPAAIRAIPEIVEEIENLSREIQYIRDPWLKRSLGARRRDLKNELAAAKKRLAEGR
jgi:hypothetical protein